MGGNDTHDKYGRPYELDDGVEALYDKLEESRANVDYLFSGLESFHDYLKKEFQEHSKNLPEVSPELAVINEIMNKFAECFDITLN